MVTYMPILKGREGEFSAVSHLADTLVPHVLPIFEVVPTANGPTKDAYRFGDKVHESLPADLAVGVDVRQLPDPADGVRRPMRDIADDLAAWLIPMLPVLHLDDGPQRMADAGYAADLHGGQAVLRLGSDTHDPDDTEAEEQLDRLRDQAGLTIEQCDLVLDVFEVRSERDLSRVEPVVRKCVSWAQRYPWRSVTVAAGAMPASISHLPVNTPTPLRRWDLQLWQRARDLDVRYADYGIAHPGMAAASWRPMPSLRYTDDEWPPTTGLKTGGTSRGEISNRHAGSRRRRAGQRNELARLDHVAPPRTRRGSTHGTPLRPRRLQILTRRRLGRRCSS